MNEDQLEQHCLEWFRDNGWETLYGPSIAPDAASPARKSYLEVALVSHLEAALGIINPHLPTSCFDQVISQVLKPESLDAITNNRAFHRLLLEGVPVQYKRDDQLIHDHGFLVDFDRLGNNRFVAVNQVTIQGAKQPRRPDVICFINGLPFAVLELKSPSDKNADIWDAFNQLQTYQEEIGDLFVFNAAQIVSDGYTARVGSLTAGKERFMPWRTIKNEDDKPLLEWQLETLVRGFFDRELFLDYLRYFILFETDGERIIKKIAGYHQFHAVREAVRVTVIAAQNLQDIAEARASYGGAVVPGSKKAGVVWHTQGSGKSISMCCYAGKLIQYGCKR